MRKNHKGFTLVELIIAVAILSIVTLAVCGFIMVGSRSYTSANTDVMLQQEAQLALNQISDVIIDTTDSINYGGKSDSASEMEMVLKDSEFSEEPTEKCLVVVNKKASNNDNPSYWFSWNKAEEVIYFNTSDDVVDESNPEPNFVDADKAVLAQHVKEFHVDISQFEQNRVVKVSMTFANGGREYTTSNNITVRNRVSLNKIDVKPMKRVVKETINTESSVTLEPGEHYTFLCSVEGNDEDKMVRWELVDGAKNGTFISSDGALSIGLEETRQSFMVRVTSDSDAGVKTTKEVRVNVKRVTNVNLSCSASSIKAGNMITVNGNALGNHLGKRCDGCLVDDSAKDWDLTQWVIVSGPADMITTDSESAEIKIRPNAKLGEKIIVEAASDLSVRKSYGPKSEPRNTPVKGRIVLEVIHSSTNVPTKSGFKFGTDNDPGPLDYMRSHLKTDHYRYVYCVRVREMDSTTPANDQVVLYYTTSANERFNPDLFGLELNRSYKVFFQVLDPVSLETRQKKNNGKISSYVEDSKDEIVNEYLNNLDSMGKYVGDKYEADDFYSGILSPPSIAITCNGVSYPNEDSDYYERYFFAGGGEMVLNQPVLDENRTVNVERNVIRDKIRYTLYKGDGNDISQWTRICGFNPDTLQYDSGYNQVPGGAISFNPTESLFLKRDINNYNWQQACGTYHITVGYVYANDPNIRGGYEYLYKNNLRGDYETHYYEQPDCTITIKIDTGVNLTFKKNGNTYMTYFPAPGENGFPFTATTGDQTAERNLTMFSKDNTRYAAKCTIKATYSGSSYSITLSEIENTSAHKKTTYTYGTFEYSTNTWNQTAPSTTSVEAIWKPRIYFGDTANMEQYMMEFPLPSDSDFPQFSGHVYEDKTSRQYFSVSDTYGENVWNYTNQNVTFKYTYNEATQIYTVTLYNSWDLTRPISDTWKCAQTGTEWEKVH
ncbi:MAG: prepilin-type N-terminal cleavage/methylation domain-containing protein [Lachnospiraceae bacterium]|nr:prepilin-type N-terminal cleavage/methylation domain-containing protein [Lachnospiraceae bacterium]